jgi:hypothetical protein
VDILSIRVHRPDGCAYDVARLLVNGRDLIDLARAAELASADSDGQPALAGGYEGLMADDVLVPSRHLLGEPLPHLQLMQDGRIPLLGCNCGEPGCWPLVARVRVGPETVTWSEFGQPYRSHWDHTALGPFSFERARYEAALASRAESEAGDV